MREFIFLLSCLFSISCLFIYFFLTCPNSLNCIFMQFLPIWYTLFLWLIFLYNNNKLNTIVYALKWRLTNHFQNQNIIFICFKIKKDLTESKGTNMHSNFFWYQWLFTDYRVAIPLEILHSLTTMQLRSLFIDLIYLYMFLLVSRKK